MTKHPTRMLATLTIFAIFMSMVSAPLAQADVIGQKRFLPLNQTSLKQKAAIVVPADPAPSPATSQTANASGFMPVSRAGFMPIKRDIMTIRSQLSNRISTSASRKATEQADRMDSQRFTTRRSHSARLKMTQPEQLAADAPTKPVKHASSGQAIMDLFGTDTIEAGHPFLK